LTDAVEASSVTVTVTVTLLPGATVNDAGLSESHATSAAAPHWSSPGSTSELPDRAIRRVPS
jgi:hypothetical protein